MDLLLLFVLLGSICTSAHGGKSPASRITKSFARNWESDSVDDWLGDWFDLGELTTIAPVSGSVGEVTATNAVQPWSPAKGTVRGSSIEMFGLRGSISDNGTVIVWSNGAEWRRKPNAEPSAGGAEPVHPTTPAPAPPTTPAGAGVDLGAAFGNASPSSPSPAGASSPSPDGAGVDLGAAFGNASPSSPRAATGATNEPPHPVKVATAPHSSAEPRSNIARIEGVWSDPLDSQPTTIQRVGESETAVTATNPKQTWSPGSGTVDGSSISMFGLRGVLISNDTVISWSNGHEWVLVQAALTAPSGAAAAASSEAVDLGDVFGASLPSVPPTPPPPSDEPTARAATAPVAVADHAAAFFGQWRDTQGISAISAGPGAGRVIGAHRPSKRTQPVLAHARAGPRVWWTLPVPKPTARINVLREEEEVAMRARVCLCVGEGSR
jgi:hypothetical protein